jgi:excisionase family DNA binding protein
VSKITTEHLSRKAYVYVRQSTPEQLKHNKESLSLQYALSEHAKELGWQSVTIIDEDLGRSASGTARSGFDRLLASVCRSEVGAIFAVEASRLARTGREWHTLLDFCGLVGTLIIDRAAVYDPRISADRLVLGMQGTMSEMEVSLFRQRSQEAINNKAKRGELFLRVPVGYLRSADGDHIEKDHDKRVREIVELAFSKFDELQTARRVYLWFLQERIDWPWVIYVDGERAIRWQAPRYSTILKVLTSPIYAGAYVYGRRKSVTRIEEGAKVVRRGLKKNREDWNVLLKEHHEGYISWERFESNLRMIANNNSQQGESVRGPVRRGEALLTGLLRCRHCGRRIYVRYNGHRGDPSYSCTNNWQKDRPQAKCFTFGAYRVDEAVAAAVLKVLQPEGMRAAMAAIEARIGGRSEQCKQTELALEQARFEADRAKRQFDRVEPENRLVVSELERRWNQRLEIVRQLEEKLQLELAVAAETLGDGEREAILQLGGDVSRAWHHPGATVETRKRIIRSVIQEILVLNQGATLELTLHWKGGEHTQITVARSQSGYHRRITPADTNALIEALARQTNDTSIASILNRNGKRTAQGNTWTADRVRTYRNDHHIPVYREGERAERGEVTVDEAAQLLGVGAMRVRRLILAGVIPAIQSCVGAPWTMKRSVLDEPSVQRAARMQGRAAPATSDPDQQNFEFSKT